LVTSKKAEQDAAMKRFLEKYPALKEKPPAESRRNMEEFISGIVDEKPENSLEKEEQTIRLGIGRSPEHIGINHHAY